MTYRHGKKWNRLAARRDDILGKDSITLADCVELTRIAVKLDALPESQDYARYIQNRLRKELAHL